MAINNEIRTAKKSKVQAEPVRYIYIILLLAYGFITVITPNWQTLDSNGPKFMTLSLLNLLTFLFLFTRKDLKTNSQLYFKFFNNYAGIAYTLLMVVSLLSFIKAINVLESVLHFAKVFTTFSAAYLISVLVLKEKRGLLVLSIAMTALLLYDSLTIFLGINRFVAGQLDTISNLKSVYSNKNILASAVFVKIPFSLWLMFFRFGWIHRLAVFTLFCAQLANLFMSTRAFYLGLIFLTLVIIFYIIFQYRIQRDKTYIKLGAIYLFSILFAFVIFSFTQKYIYPKTGDTYNKGVAQRLATISSEESSAGLRLQMWKRSLQLIKADPLLGVGAGNWKIAGLKEENKTSPGYILNYKNHNDFLETTAETGLFGGFLFLSIFVFVIWRFGKKIINKSSEEELSFLFLPAFGLFAYSFDAFFNFPQDRPEIAVFFAIYVGMGIAVGKLKFWKVPAIFSIFDLAEKRIVLSKRISKYILIVIFSTSFCVLIPVLMLNFKSLKNQLIVFTEIEKGKLTSSTNSIIDNFPTIPNLSAVGEPIAVQKARYLISEKRFKEAEEILISDNSSPFDARKEFFLSRCFHAQNKPDSALYYAELVYKMKPNFFVNIQLICDLLYTLEKANDGKDMLNNYFKKNKKDGNAWLYGYSYYARLGEIKKATALLDSASYYVPENPLFAYQKAFAGYNVNKVFYDESFENAIDAYNDGNYDVSEKLLSLIIKSKEECDECRIRRAFCYYSLGEYEKSIQDLEFLVNRGVKQPNIYNLIGVDYYLIDKNIEACKYFELAKNLNDPQGIINFERYCNSAPQN